jgi:hypothetical protein
MNTLREWRMTLFLVPRSYFKTCTVYFFPIDDYSTFLIMSHLIQHFKTWAGQGRSLQTSLLTTAWEGHLRLEIGHSRLACDIVWSFRWLLVSGKTKSSSGRDWGKTFLRNVFNHLQALSHGVTTYSVTADISPPWEHLISSHRVKKWNNVIK